MAINMTQEQVYAILSLHYGKNVCPLGADGNSIFWCYNHETEEDYKIHTVTTEDTNYINRFGTFLSL